MDNITFLYTLANGVCPKSYGFFTARMAGIGVEVNLKRIQNFKILSICSWFVEPTKPAK